MRSWSYEKVVIMTIVLTDLVSHNFNFLFYNNDFLSLFLLMSVLTHLIIMTQCLIICIFYVISMP